MLLIACFAALCLGVQSLVPLYYPSEVIEGSYIAVFHNSVSLEKARAFAQDFQAKRVFNIGNRFKAFNADLSSEVLDKLRTHTDLIKYIEADSIVRTLFTTQNNATWGLDRVDQTNLPLNTQYRYFETAGTGVDIYIIDTGINIGHQDFGGRAAYGYDFHNGQSSAEDDNGHGTHCASTSAGTTWGVAKGARLFAVKVLGRLGSGSLANVAAGVAWAAEQHNSAPNKRSVASMSLGGGASAVMDDAVEAAIEDGLPVVVASGNSNTDACSTSPARVPTAFTVNAATNSDTRASFSNYGSCTDIFAPGQDITAAWIGSSTATNTISGTSMACPHVAGACAVALSQRGVMTPAALQTYVKSVSTPNVLTNIGAGSTNLLLFSPYQ